MPQYLLTSLNDKPENSLRRRDKVWWTDNCGHEWQATYDAIKSGQGCAVCANKIILPGFNDLASKFPDVAAQWDKGKNGLITPKQVSSKSNKSYHWVCDKGHEWEAKVSNRTVHKSGCPICSGRKVLTGFNDLATTHPTIAEQWNFKKNTTLTPKEVTGGSSKKVWWVCDKGHEWVDSVSHRKQGRSCPTCTSKNVLPGFNDLETLNPQLASEWATEQNILQVNEVTGASSYQATWVCKKGHQWQARVVDRKRGTNCPQCNHQSYSSRPELEIYNLLLPYHPDIVRNTRTLIHPYEVDIYVPGKNIAIEFNGLYWHSEETGKGKAYHHNKYQLLKNKGIQLIQVWEDDWNRNPELMKRILAHKLHLPTTEPKIYARNTEIALLTQNEVNVFLNQHHIQGAVDGKIRIGLVEKTTNIHKNLVAVAVLKTEPGSEGNQLNLLRFATSSNVPGGFSKILSHIEKTYKPHSITTFSDNTVSDGNLYKQTGFTAIAQLPPDYMYVYNRKRIHKFNFRIGRVKTNPNLKYEEGFTEKELAKLNNVSRIWDAGKIKWQKLYIDPPTP